MVKKPAGSAISFTSFSSSDETRRAAISPSGGVAGPNRLRSAFVNGRAQAKLFPATNQVRLPKRMPSVTSGSEPAMAAMSASEVTWINVCGDRESAL